MTARYRALVELVVACAALVGAAVCWAQTRSMVTVGPVADGQPVTFSVVYHPQALLLTLLLAMLAGVLVVVAAARLLRVWRSARPKPSS
ncbi:hypothetical protein [Mycobacterium lacus]|uniref:Uncharacterized protein n=1 Tax=Mycobacterium lacus TaxID=169765 RepID=A0A1X1YSB8_9MYCO|nr:hypothetical protein [Mycobacterium lacus]MCV7123878.1 hypothetical protein [Mycobacterium lacus]ORW14007.1 hypothetical protein AWC15_13835 [Mycobacterium lacus]BBX98348.1 hypothetical protein MLAC_36420 [Mycobacterium lacus]